MGKHLRIPELIHKKDLPEIIQDTDLISLIDGTDDRRHSLVKRALAREDLVQVRRGLYTLGELHRRQPIHSLVLAQRIYGPSYISFESALSYWSLIPEAVYTVTSGCTQRSTSFETPFGNYEYVRIPFQPLYVGVIRKQESAGPYFMAKPLRALADYVYSSKKKWDIHSLAESLRLDNIPDVKSEDLDEMMEFYDHSRVRAFLKSYRRRITK